MQKVSIIMPTMEEPAAFDVVKKTKELMPDAEIIVVDKSSSEYKERIKRLGVRLLNQTTSGYENALVEGFKAAHGDILVTIDPDGTYDPSDIPREVKIIEDGKADMVLGNRMNKKMRKGAMQGYIKFGNAALSKLYSMGHSEKLKDVLPGLFAFRKEAFDSIKDIKAYRAGTAFFTMEVAKKGFSIVDIPISYYPREGTKSKLAKSKLLYGVGVAGHIVRYARDYSPLLIFGSIGALLILAGLVVGLLVLMNFLATGTLSEVGRALIAFMLVTLGFLSVIAGLIMDLLLDIARKLDRL